MLELGEALPVRGTVDSTDANFLETSCIGMAGSHCVVGNCMGVVIFTGDGSVFGRVLPGLSESLSNANYIRE
jgi:sodium/potassium-transporting ATPase subunit alpha